MQFTGLVATVALLFIAPTIHTIDLSSNPVEGLVGVAVIDVDAVRPFYADIIAFIINDEIIFPFSLSPFSGHESVGCEPREDGRELEKNSDVAND